MKFCRPRVAMRQMGYTTCASKWPSYLVLLRLRLKANSKLKLSGHLVKS